MIQTYTVASPDLIELQGGINIFLKRENITRHELIDIKFQSFSLESINLKGNDRMQFVALIIYDKKKPLLSKKDLTINDPLQAQN